MIPVHKILLVDCNSDGDFFDKWIEYLRPRHHLTKSEQKFLAACLRTRHHLSKVISDENVLDETCLNENYREKIKVELGISNLQFLNLISQLKKLKILIPRYQPFSEKVAYYKISPSFIPNYKDGEDFKILIVFKDGQRDIQTSSEGVQSSSTDNKEDIQELAE